MLGKQLIIEHFSKTTALVCMVFIMLFKFNTVLAQNVNFSLTSTDLGLVYENESHFETERVIPEAIRLDIGYSRRNLMVSAKTVSTLNYAFSRIPSDMYSIQLVNTSAYLSSNYSRKFKLDFTEQTILVHARRGGGNFYEYDLIVDPVSFEYEPGQYFYSIIFTLTEQ